MNKFEFLEKKMCKELEALDQKLEAGSDMTVQDLEKIDKLAHAMKSLATYKAMKDAEEYTNHGIEGRQSKMYGREDEYSEGYSRGYSEAMNQSGHYPPPRYPERRW